MLAKSYSLPIAICWLCFSISTAHAITHCGTFLREVIPDLVATLTPFLPAQKAKLDILAALEKKTKEINERLNNGDPVESSDPTKQLLADVANEDTDVPIWAEAEQVTMAAPGVTESLVATFKSGLETNLAKLKAKDKIKLLKNILSPMGEAGKGNLTIRLSKKEGGTADFLARRDEWTNFVHEVRAETAKQFAAINTPESWRILAESIDFGNPYDYSTREVLTNAPNSTAKTAGIGLAIASLEKKIPILLNEVSAIEGRYGKNSTDWAIQSRLIKLRMRASDARRDLEALRALQP
jgi:hypothetical protein